MWPGHHDLLVAGQQVIPVTCDQLVVRRLVLLPILRVLRHVQRDAEVRQDVERAQAQFVRVVPDQVRRPPAPAGSLAVNVGQLVVVIEDVIGDAIDDAAQRRLLAVGRNQVVVDRIDEVVADNLVRAGSPFHRHCLSGVSCHSPSAG